MAVSEKTGELMSFAHMWVDPQGKNLYLFKNTKGYKFLYLYVDSGWGSNTIRPVRTVCSTVSGYDLLELLLFFDLYLEESWGFSLGEIASYVCNL